MDSHSLSVGWTCYITAQVTLDHPLKHEFTYSSSLECMFSSYIIYAHDLTQV